MGDLHDRSGATNPLDLRRDTLRRRGDQPIDYNQPPPDEVGVAIDDWDANNEPITSTGTTGRLQHLVADFAETRRDLIDTAQHEQLEQMTRARQPAS